MPFSVFSQTYLFGILEGGGSVPVYPTLNIVCDGNSLTYGYEVPADSSYPSQLSETSPFSTNGTVVYNLGVSGQSTIDMINDYGTQVAPLYTSNPASVLVAWELTNDLYNTGNADTVINRMVRFCQMGQATGFDVVVMTAIARKIVGTTTGGDDQSSFDTKLAIVNSYIKLNYLSFANSMVPLDETFTDFNNTTYYKADGVHLKPFWYGVVCNLLIPQLL